METRCGVPERQFPSPGREAGVEELARELAAEGAEGCSLAIVLGSGLAGVSEALADRREIPADGLPHLLRPGVGGHAGSIVAGRLGGVRVLVQSGRVHLYEGRTPAEVTRAVRAFARVGVRALVLTNAAGGMVPEWPPGTLMRVTDHLNLQGRSPLARDEGGKASPYDGELGALLEDAARELRIELRSGVYAGLLGPSYETPAEIRALRLLGARAVGMSTVAEASAAHAAGLRVVALACIANPAAGLAAEPLRHADVLAVMQRASGRLARLLQRVVPTWERALAGRA